MKLSIIISTLNIAKTLQRCLDSIAVQNYKNIELILIDGGSNDGTVEIIKNNSSIIANYISEKDNGIYDAWNKGVALAKGDWIYFIGGDDKLFEESTISKIIHRLKILPEETMIVYGSILATKSDGHSKTYGKAWNEISENMNSFMCIPHQGTFHSSKLVKKYGFDSNLKIAGDYKLIMQSLKYAKPIFLDDIIVANQNVYGVSALRKNRMKTIEEFRKVQSELGIPMTFKWLCEYFKSVVWKVLSYFLDVKA